MPLRIVVILVVAYEILLAQIILGVRNNELKDVQKEVVEHYANNHLGQEANRIILLFILRKPFQINLIDTFLIIKVIHCV